MRPKAWRPPPATQSPRGAKVDLLRRGRSGAGTIEQNARRRLWDALPLLAGVVLLVYVISGSPLGEILAAMRRTGPLILIAPLVVGLCWQACNTSAFSVLLGGRVSWGVLYWNRLV